MTSERILIINAGSSSLKVGLFDTRGRCSARAAFESIGAASCGYTARFGTSHKTYTVRGITDHKAVLSRVLDDFYKHGITRAQIKIVGHRIVHGGGHDKPVILSKAVEAELKGLIPLAPLHQDINLRMAQAAKRLIPKAAHFAAFDTAFFSELPAEAATYPMARSVARKYKFKRFGFHGFSHAWSAEQAARLLKKPLSKVNSITLHLGAGVSVAAIKHGRPIETSMGATPFEGLMMATRTGDIDPGIILILLQDGWSPERITQLISKESGWYGLTGYKDFRDVITMAGHPIAGWPVPKKATLIARRQARLAIDVFVHRIVKYIGAYRALLGSVDALVFSGAIGTRSSVIRDLIKRSGGIRPGDRVLVVEADEEGSIARAILKLIS